MWYQALTSPVSVSLSFPNEVKWVWTLIGNHPLSLSLQLCSSQDHEILDP